MKKILSVVFLAYFLAILSGCGGGGGSPGGAAGGGTPDQDLFNTGYAAYNATSYASAATSFESLIAQYPNSSLVGSAYFYLGKCNYHLNDFTGAIAKFDIVLSAYPSNSFADDALLWKGKSRQQLANLQFAAGNLANAATIFSDARAIYQSVITNYPGTTLVPDCNYQIGLSYFDEHRYVEAIPLLQAVVTSYPASTVADGAQYYFARSLHGKALNEQISAPLDAPGDFVLARAEYVKLYTNYPLSIFVDNTYYQIGKTHYDEANFVAAIAQFDYVLTNYAASSIADSAQYYKARSVNGTASVSKLPADYALARTEYVKLYTNYPLSIFVDNAYYQIGLTYFDEANYVAAIAQFEYVLANYATSTSAASAQYYKARSINGTASISKLPADYALARAEYVKLYTNFPLSIYVDNAYYRIGKTYYDEANYLTAIAELNIFLTSYPTSSYFDDGQYYVGRSHHILLDYPAARTAYAAAIAFAPAGILADNAAYHSAFTYDGSKQCTLELSAMQAFVLAYPLSPFVATANTHIADLSLVTPLAHGPCI
ncbi:MAG: tetratricopeptide repeat protein [Nitrosomonadales bacterium]|nr:tetratricopeptide repeat protein [Nitrosomonadales bacterium]